MLSKWGRLRGLRGRRLPGLVTVEQILRHVISRARLSQPNWEYYGAYRSTIHEA